MKKTLIAIALLLVATTGWGGCFPSFPSFGRWQDGCGAEWWNDSSLTFYAPFDDPSNPLRLIKGTGTLSFTRATTATYVHPTTGLVTTAAINVARVEEDGVLIEGQRTNPVVRSRTLNNAAWTATNVTVDNTITGEDGVANSASWVAASADNGTICQAVTIASAAYSGAFSLKRITGTGTVMISLDNGATYGSDVASSLSESAWYRASKENQTLANPELCLKLGTSGDNVAVDYAQIEAGKFVSSRIGTTTAAVTRNVDALTFASSGNIDGTVGTVTATVDYNTAGNFFNVVVVVGANAADRNVMSFRTSDGEKLKTYDGTNNPGWLTALTTTPAKYATRWGAGKMSGAINGTMVSPESNFDGNMDLGTTTVIGWYTGISDPNDRLWGHIKNLRIWSRAFTDAELVTITTP